MSTVILSRSLTKTSPWRLKKCSRDASELAVIELPPGRLVLGRSSQSDLQVAGFSVSKQHAQLIVTEDSLFVRDLSSTNGTFVNRKRVTHDFPLGQGDILQLADIEFLVQLDSPTQQQIESKVAGTVEVDGIESSWVISGLQKILMDRCIDPHYQAVVDLTTRKPIGYEVLARTTLPNLEMPLEMFYAAEQAGQEVELSVMCRDLGVDRFFPKEPGSILFLNTHPHERLRPELLDSMHALRLKEPELRIVLELHEAAMTNLSDVKNFRTGLKALGVQLAFDDFGAGQARLKELAEVAPDYVKFDIGLIRDIHKATARRKLVEGLVSLANSLGITCVAEGIEQTSESKVCQEIGFSLGQGYLFGKPAIF
jgi:EAL domain-containing protein (putative c-di-GMP-specific phosphodiesterase class I)